jgi:hypothetical protein
LRFSSSSHACDNDDNDDEKGMDGRAGQGHAVMEEEEINTIT